MKGTSRASWESLDAGGGAESARVLRAAGSEDMWIALLDLAVGLTPEDGPAALIERTLDGLSQILPGHAMGVCLGEGDGEPPLVDVRLPPGVAPPRRDPSRLFPDLSDECVCPLLGLSGSTLHVASIEHPMTPVEQLVAARTAAILSAGLRTARSLARPAPRAEEGSLGAQLVQAEKLASFGQLVAGVVHELANPLTSIVASTEMLLRKESLDADVAAQVRRIEVSAERVLGFIRDLVSYARPAREQPEPVSIADVVRQAHSFTEHEFRDRGVEFRSDCDESRITVRGQVGPLVQVFVNLFTNAAHAMERGGGRLHVRATVVTDSSQVLVEVADTGVGISPETVSRVFEPFFTTKERGRGTGLGLSIVREIVAMHGGSVAVVSTPGEGSCFTVALPWAAPPT